MPKNSPSGHIETTETILRLYVFLAQFLDRCVDETARKEFPQQELQAHLSTTRTTLMEILVRQPRGQKQGWRGM